MFRRGRVEQEATFPEDSDFDVVTIGQAMLANNNGCGVSDGEACPDCWQAAKVVVSNLRKNGRLDEPTDSLADIGSLKVLSGPWHFDIPDDNPDVQTLIPVLESADTYWSAEPERFGKVAVAALLRTQRLELPVVAL